MPSSSDLTFVIKADTSQFDRAMRRVRRRIWWIRRGSFWAGAVGGLIGAGVGDAVIALVR